MAIFKAFIVSNFHYCPLVWHFCGKVSTAKMERVQERALRFVLDDHISPYETLLGQAGVSTLTLSRIRYIAAEVYKAQHDMGPPYVCDMFVAKHQSQYNLRHINET